MADSLLPRPGDIIFCHGAGFVPACIRFGERMRWLTKRPSRRTISMSEAAHWSHVAIMVEPDPETKLPRVIQAGAHGVEYALFKDLDAQWEAVSPQSFPAVLADDTIRTSYVIDQAHLLVGAKYGWLTILSIIVNLVTPTWFKFPDFRRGATYICSAAGAWCLHAAGANIDTNDVYQIMPSELRALSCGPSIASDR